MRYSYARGQCRGPESGDEEFKSNKAPWSSGITIEMVKRMNDENLERIAGSMDKMILGGRQVPATWNKTVLRPLPKSEAGLYV